LRVAIAVSQETANHLGIEQSHGDVWTMADDIERTSVLVVEVGHEAKLQGGGVPQGTAWHLKVDEGKGLLLELGKLEELVAVDGDGQRVGGDGLMKEAPRRGKRETVKQGWVLHARAP
jgi:hypothetical protein